MNEQTKQQFSLQRIYVKDVERGTASVALSPEEQTAVERAMAR